MQIIIEGYFPLNAHNKDFKILSGAVNIYFNENSLNFLYMESYNIWNIGNDYPSS